MVNDYDGESKYSTQHWNNLQSSTKYCQYCLNLSFGPFFLFFSLFCTTFIDFSIFLSVRLLFGFILSFRRFETKTKFLILKSGFLNFAEKAAAIIRNYVQNPISKRLEMKKNMNFAAIFIKRGTVYHLLNQKSKQSKWK